MNKEKEMNVTLVVSRKPWIVGVMGSHQDTGAEVGAYRLGKAIAERSYVLLTGGGTGIMREASRGAHEAGGLVLGVLPNDRKRPMEGYPNEFVDIAIYTGMGEARNVINVKTPHVLIAMTGGAGTLSEIAMAMRAETPIIGLDCPEVTIAGPNPIVRVTSVEEAILEMDHLIMALQDNT